MISKCFFVNNETQQSNDQEEQNTLSPEIPFSAVLRECFGYLQTTAPGWDTLVHFSTTTQEQTAMVASEQIEMGRNFETTQEQPAVVASEQTKVTESSDRITEHKDEPVVLKEIQTNSQQLYETNNPSTSSAAVRPNINDNYERSNSRSDWENLRPLEDSQSRNEVQVRQTFLF